jgi:hypothetical protein
MLNVLAFIIDNLQEKDISKKYKLMCTEIVYLRFSHEIKGINQKIMFIHIRKIININNSKKLSV